MKPRTDICALDFDENFNETIKTCNSTVIPECLFTGVILTTWLESFTKDLVPYLDELDHYEWRSLIRNNLFYVPEKPVKSMICFMIFKAKSSYGHCGGWIWRTSSLVTLEDIMEQIVGKYKMGLTICTTSIIQCLIRIITYLKVKPWSMICAGSWEWIPILFNNVRGSADSIACTWAYQWNAQERSGNTSTKVSNSRLCKVDKRRIEKLKSRQK